MASFRDKLNKNNKNQETSLDKLRRSKPAVYSTGLAMETEEDQQAVSGMVPLGGSAVPAADGFISSGVKPQTNTEKAAEQVSAQNPEVSNQSEQISGPDDFERQAVKFSSQLEDLDKSEAAWLRSHYDKLDKKRAELQQAYKTNQDRVKIAEIADVIGQAFVKLGAAAEGLKTGRDMSGMAFRPRDWSREYDRALQEYKMSEDTAEAQSRQDREIYKAETATDKEAKRNQYQAALRDITAANSEAKRRAKEIERSSKDDAKKAKALEKERRKVEERFNQARGLMLDIEEGRIKADKAIPKIRQLTGAPAEELETASKERGGRSISSFWMTVEPDQLKALVDKMEKKQLEYLGGSSQPAEQSTGPKPGTVQDGYRFKGGDPADSKNWEQVR